jgi:hypothetical protein
MDRIIVYPGAIPLDTDMLATNRNTMIALHALIAATLGTNTAVDGFAVSATVPASMQIAVGPGSMTQYGALDSTAYGSLPADLTDAVVKMGISLAPQSFTLTAPATAGTSIAYLVQASFGETDQNPVVLPYYNAANPAMPYLGPGNSGAAQATLRQQTVTVAIKPGTAAATGTQLVPPVDPGWIGLAAVRVDAGATQVTQSVIFTAQTTRYTPWKLPDLTPGFAFCQVFGASGTFIVPNAVTRLRATVIGGGGGGGSVAPGGTGAGGGGAGARGEAWLSGITPGSLIPVTIGGLGVGVGASAGTPGGTSSFGTYCSAGGGAGGLPGTSSANGTGGAGGQVSGGSIYFPGSSGTDAVPGIARGGDGGGPGGGKGGSGNANGANAASWGGGGGGASGSGLDGGSGGGGLVIVEW